MPLLFWMPMIIFCGMWDIAERSAQDIAQAVEPHS